MTAGRRPRRRAHWRYGLRDRREQPARLRIRQRHRRHALMSGLHEASPDFHRQSAAGCLLGRRTVVVAEPDAGDKIGRVADEPGVAEILAGAGLAGGHPARQFRLVRGAGEQRLLHHRVHHRDVMRVDHLAELIGGTHIENLAIDGADFGDDMRRDAETAIGKRRIGAHQFDQRDFGGAERDRGVGIKLR